MSLINFGQFVWRERGREVCFDAVRVRLGLPPGRPPRRPVGGDPTAGHAAASHWLPGGTWGGWRGASDVNLRIYMSSRKIQRRRDGQLRSHSHRESAKEGRRINPSSSSFLRPSPASLDGDRSIEREREI